MTPSSMLRITLLGITTWAGAAVAAPDDPQMQRLLALDRRPSAQEAKPHADAGVQLLDVRSSSEWDTGHVRGARHLPWTQVGKDAASVLPDRDQPVIVYCASGPRAWWAARSLRNQGYTRVVAVSGGLRDLIQAGLPLKGPTAP